MIIHGQFGFNCPKSQTVHECSLDGPLQTLRFLFRYEIQNGGYGRTYFNIGPTVDFRSA
jgi:hypothetical protein